MANFIDFTSLFPDTSPQIVRLTQNHLIKPFDCGDTDLNDFLSKDSKLHLKHSNHTTFIIETKNETVAYYSLANDLLRIDKTENFRNDLCDIKFDNEYEDYFFDQAEYPAVKLGRIAVNKNYQSKGIGRFILDSLIHSFTYNNKTGCQFITVDAINNSKVTSFYIKNSFCHLTLNDINKASRLMYRCLLNKCNWL